jgi:hypothetical protein
MECKAVLVRRWLALDERGREGLNRAGKVRYLI